MPLVVQKPPQRCLLAPLESSISAKSGFFGQLLVLKSSPGESNALEGREAGVALLTGFFGPFLAPFKAGGEGNAALRA